MVNLDTTTALLKVVTSAAAAVDTCVSYVDYDSPSTFTAAGQNQLITTAATTTICDSPTGTKIRNIKSVVIRNSHASTANTVEVLQTDGTTQVSLFKTTLAAQEVLAMSDAGVWFVYDANGGVKMGASAASDTLAGLIEIAVQTDMEAATSNVLAVVPGRQHFHPGHAKFVCMTTGTTTPAMQTPPSYNMTSITDTGVGRLTVTIATDFSSANWCCLATVIGISTTLTAIANVQTSYIRTATIAAGSVEVNARDATATTNALADPSGYMVVGFGDHA